MGLAPADVPELLALGLDAYVGTGTLRARLLSDAQLRARSHGQLRNPESINRRTQKPERDGLFCARVFGPIEDYTCICGKYVGEQHLGITCDRCGVELLPSAVRCERFGHIELAAPIVHPLCKHHVARLLQLEPAELDALLVGFEAPQLGALTVRETLARLRVEAMDHPMRVDPELAALGHYLEPAQLMVEVLLVLPAGLRPLEQLGDRKLALDDLSELYRRVIVRNGRLQRLIELSAPMIILANEYLQLQVSVEQLMINERTAKPLRRRHRDLRSLELAARERWRARHPELALPDTLGALLAGGAVDLPAAQISRAASRRDEPDYDF